MPSIKTCIATVSIPGSFREKISAIAAAGFNAIELFEPDLLAYGGTARDAGSLIRDNGLEIAILQPFRDFEGRPASLRDGAFEEAKRKFDLMVELGTPLVLVCSTIATESLGDPQRIAEDFFLLGQMAEERGLRVGYEALAWGRHVRDVSQSWDIVCRCGHPSVGLVLDSFHLLIRQNNPEDIREIPGNKIFFVQIADAPHIDMDVLQLSRHYRTLPGKGSLDVDAFVRALLATGYSGPLSLEIFRSSFVVASNQIATEYYEGLMEMIARTTN
jgi:4-hydroxyphenylpyruvate dioxygenase